MPSENQLCDQPETPSEDDCQNELVEVGAVSETKGGVFGITHDPGLGYIFAR